MLCVIILVATGLCQSFSNLDLAAGVGDCEIDIDQNRIADGWITYHTWGNQPIHDIGAIPSISTAQRYSGIGSQQIVFNRSSGTAGRLHFQYNILNNRTLPALNLPEGIPLIFRVRMQTQNLQGVTPRIYLRMGDRFPVNIAPSVPNNTGGWQTFSAIIPLERASNGEFVVHFVIEFACQDGALSGSAWFDAVECVWTQFGKPQRTRPNEIRILHYIAPINHWTYFLHIPPDFLIMNPGIATAIKSHLTDIQIGVYLDPASTRSDGLYPLLDLYGGYQWVLQNHPSWLLRDSSGQPVRNTAYPYLYLIDIGLPQVQQHAMNHIRTISQTLPLPEWIFFDGVCAWWPSVQYPTLDSVFPAWTSYLQQVCSFIRNTLRRKTIINLGSWAGNFVDNNPGVQWLSQVDAVMLEHTVVLYSRTAPHYRYQPYRHNVRTLFRTDTSWWATLRAVTENPNTKWLLVVMWDSTDTAMLRYILASYLIFQHGNTYLMVEDRGQHGSGNVYQLWVTRPEVWVPLGRATGNWRILAGTIADNSGALFARDYEHGIVIVNPTESQTYQFRVPRNYKNWDGNIVPEGTILSIGPKTGLVLYAAPEITITITPQTVTVLPGQSVTFTVQYRNQGLREATNVTINVPLPEGLVYVGSSSGGRFSNQQVIWTLPSIPAGASGILTFEARVQ